jgi:hypothetical protein
MHFLYTLPRVRKELENRKIMCYVETRSLFRVVRVQALPLVKM